MSNENAQITLTHEEKTRIAEWLNDKSPSLKCPSCEQRNFAIADHYVCVPAFSNGAIMFGGTTYPMFLLVCSNCSYIMAYSAVSSGIVKGESSDEAAE